MAVRAIKIEIKYFILLAILSFNFRQTLRFLFLVLCQSSLTFFSDFPLFLKSNALSSFLTFLFQTLFFFFITE